MKDNTQNIEIKVEKTKWNNALDKAFNKIIKKIKIDGFRQGKVPRDIYEKKYGKESLYKEAIDIVLPNIYNKMIEEEKLEPISIPSIDIKEINDNEAIFILTVTTAPEVKLGKYTKLGVKKEEVTVTKEEIEKGIENIKERYAEVSLKDGNIEVGDIAIIDYEGFIDGVAFDGGEAFNYSLTIGSASFIEGFEDGLIGLKKGEIKDLNLKFPDDYPHEQLKGKDVLFKVKVNEIKSRIIPELNKELFEDLNFDGVDSKESLEEYVKSIIKKNKEIEIENKFIDDLLNKIALNIEVDIPDSMIDDEKERLVIQFEESLKLEGLSVDLYYKLTDSNKEILKEKMENEALNRITNRLILKTIAEKENIEVTKEEIEKETDGLANFYQISKEQLLKDYGNKAIEFDTKMRKTIEFLKENN